jgi:hypothetical protein
MLWPAEPVGILAAMAPPRTLLLFDPDRQPQCWNERMAAGEYAVLYSGSPPARSTPSNGAPSSGPGAPGSGPGAPGGGPFCTVFSTLDEAVDHATQQVALLPMLRCRIYDHHGLGREPVQEIRGSEYKGDSEISARFRRWVGSVLFVGGAALIALDWSQDFGLSWPAMVGTRMMPVGLILLVTEGVIVFDRRRRSRRATETHDERR